MTEMFGEAWPPMSVPDLAPDDDDDPRMGNIPYFRGGTVTPLYRTPCGWPQTVTLIV